ncbi:hypothetical protein [Lacticaseibacillus paracasei]|uniref:hypothetical protein n=2 Tax=Lacticaseibacillus paracasei TaxID=1597 RepID=UPI003B504A06
MAMTLNKAIHYLLLIGISGVFLFTLAAAMGWVNQGDFALPLLLLAVGLTLFRETVLVQIFLADLILVYWVPRNEGLRA